MNYIKYHMQLGVTSACTNRLIEVTKGTFQRDRKGYNKDCFIFYSWFSPKQSEEYAMEVGAEFIGMVKTYTKYFCTDTIENITKDWPGGSYLVLRIKPMVSGGRPLIAVSQKYNVWKVLYFIVTDHTGRTKAGLPCLSNYYGQFYNPAMCHFYRPLVMYKFFGSVNEVDYHNKSRQSDLSLEKFQATQCGWIGLCMTFSMVNTITN